MATCLIGPERRGRESSWKRARRFWRDQSGGISIMYGAVLPGLIGLTGLGVETGFWYYAKRDLQTQADAGSLGGVWEIAWNRDDEVTASATNETVRNGFPNDIAFTTITVNNPPTSGPEVGNDNAVEVILTQDYDPMFSGLFRSSDVTIAARAVSTLIAQGEACILALNGTISDAAETTGNTTINAPDCTIAANSDADDAISFSGSADVLFESAWTSGGIDGYPDPDVTLLDGANENMWPIEDPYENLPDDAPNGCEVNGNQNINGAAFFTADGGEETICGNIAIHNGAVVDFAPGTYWMKGSNLDINGGLVTCLACEPGGDGVTFVFTTPNNGNVNQIGTVQINGNATVILNAPLDSPTDHDGVLFFQDPDTPSQNNNRAIFNGGAGTILNGAIYWPNNEVQWSGNNTLASTCTLIVADTVTLTGNSGFSVANCAEQGINVDFIRKIALVE